MFNLLFSFLNLKVIGPIFKFTVAGPMVVSVSVLLVLLNIEASFVSNFVYDNMPRIFADLFDQFVTPTTSDRTHLGNLKVALDKSWDKHDIINEALDKNPYNIGLQKQWDASYKASNEIRGIIAENNLDEKKFSEFESERVLNSQNNVKGPETFRGEFKHGFTSAACVTAAVFIGGLVYLVISSFK